MNNKKEAAAVRRQAEAVRLARVRQLFEARPFSGPLQRIEDRTEKEVLTFYGWLHQHHPELLPKRQGDMYKHLKVDLSGLYK
jgi:hypothetical protein